MIVRDLNDLAVAAQKPHAVLPCSMGPVSLAYPERLVLSRDTFSDCRRVSGSPHPVVDVSRDKTDSHRVCGVPLAYDDGVPRGTVRIVLVEVS